MHQNTISNKIYFKGIGLHTGLDVNLELHPAKENSGITFFRKDLNKKIEASWKNVISTKFSTNLGVDNCFIKTVEHLLSAFAGLHISNCDVFIDNEEVPIMDGSSKVFVDEILKTGIKNQIVNQQAIEIKKKVRFDCDYGYGELLPNLETEEGLNIFLESRFEGKYEDQTINIENLNGGYPSKISQARTFGFYEEIEYLKSQNLIKGGSLDNAIVIKEFQPINPEGLRYDNELMRHKVLDVVGDLYLSGFPIIGKYNGFKTGHYITYNLLKELFKDQQNFKIINSN
ncbi:MAG: UDP-3-O-acyl-N-acetylglucosamine deacetylase [Alphaproteobacteria bacterium]|jgi:UDP-3-O-[3-hydroxymyristoyl] N-acetylglucosamine deacetylase|tara:strand:- start:716 stop:1573 length:858 start_codon:yes stop_codon:yes gene_type:complete